MGNRIISELLESFLKTPENGYIKQCGKQLTTSHRLKVKFQLFLK